MPTALPMPSPALLQNWTAVASYRTYAEAQRAVDHLSDQRFAVRNVAIVGSDLRSIERVTGRLSWGRAALLGVGSGAYIGLFVGLILGLFTVGSWLAVILSCVLWGALFGLIFGLVSYAFTRGQRDFTSVQGVVALRYDVLVEPALSGEAGRLLGITPPSV